MGHLSQAEGIVKLPVGEQPGIRGEPWKIEHRLFAFISQNWRCKRITDWPHILQLG